MDDGDYFKGSKKIVDVYDRRILDLAKDFVIQYKELVDENIFLKRKY